MSIKIPESLASELSWSSPGVQWDGYTVIGKQELSSSRWESHHALIITDGSGKFFQQVYSLGLTESQESTYFEDNTDKEGMVDFYEVEPYVYTETRYKRKE